MAGGIADSFGIVEGYLDTKTALADLAIKRVNFDQKKVDLKTSEATFKRQTELTDLMAQAGPPVGNTPQERAADYLFKESQAAASTGDVEMSAKAANIASGIIQNDAYARSITLQANKAQTTELAGLPNMVYDDASMKTVFEGFEARTGKKGVGIFRDSQGNMLPYSPEMMDRIRHSADKATSKLTEDLQKAKIDSEHARERQLKSVTDLNEARAKAIREGKTAMGKAGAAGLIPKPANIKLITDMAKEIVNTDSKDVAASVDLISQDIATTMEGYMRQGMSRTAAATRAFAEAKDQHHDRFAGLPRNKERKGKVDNPLPMPLGDDGKVDPTKLKRNTFVMGTGKQKGVVLYWNGKEFSLPDVSKPAEDDGGTAYEDDNPADDEPATE